LCKHGRSGLGFCCFACRGRVARRGCRQVGVRQPRQPPRVLVAFPYRLQCQWLLSQSIETDMWSENRVPRRAYSKPGLRGHVDGPELAWTREKVFWGACEGLKMSVPPHQTGSMEAIGGFAADRAGRPGAGELASVGANALQSVPVDGHEAQWAGEAQEPHPAYTGRTSQATASCSAATITSTSSTRKSGPSKSPAGCRGSNPHQNSTPTENPAATTTSTHAPKRNEREPAVPQRHPAGYDQTMRAHPSAADVTGYLTEAVALAERNVAAGGGPSARWW
jgi:hypothetical protein